MSFRPGSRIFNAFRPFFSRQANQRRYASAAAAEEGGFSKFFNSPVGPKTVHFWAPVMKFCLAATGAADFARPAEALSLSQNAALMTTGAIWTRWCFIIKPKNLFLASINFLLCIVGTIQVGRILSYRRTVGTEALAKAEGKELQSGLKGDVEKAKVKAEEFVKQ